MGHPSQSSSFHIRARDLRYQFLIAGPTIVPQPILQTESSDLSSTDSQKLNLVWLGPRLL